MKIAGKLCGVVFLSLLVGMIFLLAVNYALVGEYGWAAFDALIGILLLLFVFALCTGISDGIKKEFDDIRKEIQYIKDDGKYRDSGIRILSSRCNDLDDELDGIREKMQVDEESTDEEEEPAEDDGDEE